MSTWTKLRAVYRYTDIPPYRCTGKAKNAIPKNPIAKVEVPRRHGGCTDKTHTRTTRKEVPKNAPGLLSVLSSQKTGNWKKALATESEYKPPNRSSSSCVVVVDRLRSSPPWPSPSFRRTSSCSINRKVVTHTHFSELFLGIQLSVL